MKIYYYLGSAEEYPQTDDWDIWNILIPISGKRPKPGDSIIMFNYNSSVKDITTVSDYEEIKEWPHPFPDAAQKHILKTIFEVK